MSLKDLHQRLQAIEQELGKYASEEERRAMTKPLMYTFVYEQQYDDAPGWGPNYQDIQAYTLADAFHIFGVFVENFPLKVRNIRYGRWSEMREEFQQIREYWEKERGHE